MSIEQADGALEAAILALIPARVSVVFPTATRIDCEKADCDNWGVCTLSLVRSTTTTVSSPTRGTARTDRLTTLDGSTRWRRQCRLNSG